MDDRDSTKRVPIDVQGDDEERETDEQAADAAGQEPGPTPNAGDPPAVEAAPDEVERLRRLYDEEHDKYLRAVAELQNFRRRSTREQAQRMQYANQELLSRIIPIMDNLHRALEHQEHAGSEEFARGVELVVQQFHEMLGSFGVEPVEAHGKPFDPTVHEAVGRVETDEVPEGTVLEVDTPGYCLHDRCLRPAKVVVAAAPGGR